MGLPRRDLPLEDSGQNRLPRYSLQLILELHLGHSQCRLSFGTSTGRCT